MSSRNTAKSGSRLGTANKLVMLLIVLVAALGSGFIYWRKSTGPRIVTPRVLEISIGATQLRIPEQLVRDPEHRANGPVTRVDLAVSWPDFTPLRAPKASGDGVEIQRHLIFIALETADGTADPAQRPSNLYSRFLTEDVTDGPGQLVSRIFKAGSPYAGEVLHIAPPNGEAFSARCAVAKGAGTRPERCLWLLRSDNLDVQVRFSEDIVGDWDTLRQKMQELLERLVSK